VNVAPAVVDGLDFGGIDVYFDDFEGLVANKMAVGRPTYTSPMTLMLLISLSSISKHICCPCLL
jgi:hypothetical protein